MSSVSRGDTITVTSTPGTYAQTGSLTITKGVTIVGPGRDNLTLTRTGVFITATPDSTAIANEERIKITGFTFDGLGSATGFIVVNGADGSNASTTKPYRYFILGDSRFKNSASSAIVIEVNRQVRGVVYNSIFDRIDHLGILLAAGSGGTGSQTEWNNTSAFPQSLGDLDNFYFEDIQFGCSTTFSGSEPGWMESGWGSRYVVRYSKWDMARCGSSPREIFDIHGSQNFSNGINGQWSTMTSEFYGIKVTNADFGIGYFRPLNHRGGYTRIWNFAIQGSLSTAPYFHISQYNGCTGTVSSVRTTEIKNSYLWNIRYGNPTPNTTITFTEDTDLCGVAANVDYWSESSSCTSSACAAGVGKGTSAPTGTCTTGVGFYVASNTSATIDWEIEANRTIMQAGKMYKCTSTNTWTLNYQPLTYPHPLRSASNPPPDAPTNVRIAALGADE